MAISREKSSFLTLWRTPLLMHEFFNRKLFSTLMALISRYSCSAISTIRIYQINRNISFTECGSEKFSQNSSIQMFVRDCLNGAVMGVVDVPYLPSWTCLEQNLCLDSWAHYIPSYRSSFKTPLFIWIIIKCIVQNMKEGLE